MSKISFVAMHHAGGLADDKYADTQGLDWKHINNAHKDRWNFVSSLGFYGGYNFYVDQAGGVTQFREIGEETAAQIGHNFDTVSICVAGNFIKRPDGTPVNQPTAAQKESVIDLLKFCIGSKDHKIAPFVAPNTIIDIDETRIHHHGFYWQTECDCLPDNYWVNELNSKPATADAPMTRLTIIDMIIGLLFKLKTLGGRDREHCGDL